MITLQMAHPTNNFIVVKAHNEPTMLYNDLCDMFTRENPGVKWSNALHKERYLQRWGYAADQYNAALAAWTEANPDIIAARAKAKADNKAAKAAKKNGGVVEKTKRQKMRANDDGAEEKQHTTKNGKTLDLKTIESLFSHASEELATYRKVHG